MPDDKEKKLKEKRVGIVKIAHALIKSKGYDNVTINDICAGANISKHTFYYYFDSKDDVLFSFLTLPTEIHAGCFAEIIEADNYFEQYMLIEMPLIEFFNDCGIEITKRLFIINLTRPINTFEFSGNGKQHIMRLKYSVLKKAHEAGEIRNSSEIWQLVHAGFSVILSTVMMWGISNGKFDLHDLVRSRLETLFDVPEHLRKSKMPLDCGCSGFGEDNDSK